jgi:hypothetical protein
VRLPFKDAELTSLSTVSNSNLSMLDNVNRISDVKLSKYSGPLNVDNVFDNNCRSAGGNGGTTIHTLTETGVTTSYSTITAAQFIDFSVPGFSELWLHGAFTNSPLPIELLSFAAVVKDEHIELDWVTGSEINNDYFNIERSVDGINFTSISTLNGAGYSSQTIFYSILDVEPLVGISYYRLKQTDYNGETSYSAIEVVRFNRSKNLIAKIYPNPVSSEITIDSESAIESIDIFNIYGSLVQTERASRFSVESLANGAYIVNIKTENGIVRSHFIKE